MPAPRPPPACGGAASRRQQRRFRRRPVGVPPSYAEDSAGAARAIQRHPVRRLTPYRAAATVVSMTRIVHAANFSLSAKGAFQHSVSIKLSNGLIRNGHSVINFADRDVARTGWIPGHGRFGRATANQALRTLCRETAPDVLLLGHADIIDAATIAAIRDDLPRIAVLQWNVDPLFDAGNIERVRQKLPVVDATLISTAGEALRPLQRAGMRLGFLPNPVDFSIETGHVHCRDTLPFDLFYPCGNPARPLRVVCGRAWNMDAFTDQLLAALPGIRACMPGVHGTPHLVGAAYQTALESAAIGLNLSRRADLELYSSDRLAHMIGNGETVLIERSTGYDRLFGDDEMGFFSSVQELINHIRIFTADTARRRAVGAAGRARYHALFNERIVARYVLDVALDRLDASDYVWPTLLDAPARNSATVT